VKALVWEGPEIMEMRDVPEPGVQPGTAIVAVGGVGLCGSELSAYLGHNELRVPPLVMGHEWAGVVTAVGSSVDAGWVGKTVTVNPLRSCGHCRACQRGDRQLCQERRIIGIDFPGAFAERVAVPVSSLLTVEDPVMGALVEPLACAVRVVNQAGVRPGDHVLVYGAGIIGLMSGWMARQAGAHVVAVTDPNPVRLAQTAKWGADEAIQPGEKRLSDRVAELTQGGPDVVIDAAGTAATRAEAAQLVRRGGTVVLVGLHEPEALLPGNRMVRDEVTVTGSFCYSDRDFRVARDLVDRRALPEPEGWLDVRPLDAGGDAFHEQALGAARFAKILLTIR
jgi:threonine dehydrogenase-like Zn-dependent dehydrogenase